MKFTLIIIAGIVILIILGLVFISNKKPELVDKSFETYSGKITDYKGNKKLIVAFTASWASIWIVSFEELKKLDKNKFDLKIVDASIDKDIIQEYSITFFPTVALIKDGKITDRIQNLMNIDQISKW